jgi:NAD(P)H-nitrite reductase large subunit
VLTDERVVSIDGEESVESVKLASGKELKADLVILGIGCVPNSELAEKTGLELGFRKGIKVDRFMRSYTDQIFLLVVIVAQRNHFLMASLQE